MQPKGEKIDGTSYGQETAGTLFGRISTLNTAQQRHALLGELICSPVLAMHAWHSLTSTFRRRSSTCCARSLTTTMTLVLHKPAIHQTLPVQFIVPLDK
jgi:hypothetical protein